MTELRGPSAGNGPTGGLIDFVRARLAEDERAAVGTGASGHPAWHVVVTDEPSSPPPEQAAHITRHGPWKVLRRVKADRQILDEVLPAINRMDDLLETKERGGWHEDGEKLLRLLALPYSDHSGYDESWRP